MRACQRCRRCPRAGQARRLRPPPQRSQVRGNVCLPAQLCSLVMCQGGGAGLIIMCLALSSCTRGGLEPDCQALAEALLHFPMAITCICLINAKCSLELHSSTHALAAEALGDMGVISYCLHVLKPNNPATGFAFAPAPSLEAAGAPGAAGAPLWYSGLVAPQTLQGFPPAPAPGPAVSAAGGAPVLGWPGLASAAGSAPALGPGSGSGSAGVLLGSAGPSGDGTRLPARPALGGSAGTLSVRPELCQPCQVTRVSKACACKMSLMRPHSFCIEKPGVAALT